MFQISSLFNWKASVLLYLHSFKFQSSRLIVRSEAFRQQLNSFLFGSVVFCRERFWDHCVSDGEAVSVRSRCVCWQAPVSPIGGWYLCYIGFKSSLVVVSVWDDGEAHWLGTAGPKTRGGEKIVAFLRAADYKVRHCCHARYYVPIFNIMQWKICYPACITFFDHRSQPLFILCRNWWLGATVIHTFLCLSELMSSGMFIVHVLAWALQSRVVFVVNIVNAWLSLPNNFCVIILSGDISIFLLREYTYLIFFIMNLFEECAWGFYVHTHSYSLIT